jgi:glutamyl-tRNA synthetase
VHRALIRAGRLGSDGLADSADQSSLGEVAAQISATERRAMAAERETVVRIVPLVQERMKRLEEAPSVMDYFFVEELPDYDPQLLIPKKMDAAGAHILLEQARAVLSEVSPFTDDALETALRGLAETMGVKVGQLFAPIRVAVCGRTVAPPLFGTLEILGQKRVLERIDSGLDKLEGFE